MCSVSPVVETLWIKPLTPRDLHPNLCTNVTAFVDTDDHPHLSAQSSTADMEFLHTLYTLDQGPSPGEIGVIPTIHTGYDDDYLSSQGR
jgi:hypothetical protein